MPRLSRASHKSALVYGGLRDANVDPGATSFIASAGNEGEAGLATHDDFGVLPRRVCFLRRACVTVGPAEGSALPVCLCALKKGCDRGAIRGVSVGLHWG